ncbi:MAG: GGDEF domain-containing protein [Gammaproteobacteria bacterium]|nr:GGDEF domain-containing protein [Gammaproteobacteria bacterium]MDP2140017.1 GGDEF domain-containing protein [Gammaproteobacteria bacterium]MDP2347833.1 GGDEF domain-containing protein [Gammaproteobacteria bacterium]
MALDLQTLFFSTIMVSLTAGGSAIYFGLRDESYRSVRDWGVATVIMSLGLTLVATRNSADELVGVMIANALLVSGMVLIYRSFLIYRLESTRDIAGWSMVGITVITVALWQVDLVSLGVRTAVVTGSIGIIMWRCAWLMSVRALPSARRSQYFTAAIYFLFAMLNTVRTLAAVFADADDALAPTLLDTVYMSSITVLWVTVTLCVIWMVVERQQEQLLRMAMSDPLTGALNRNAMLAEFERERYRCSRHHGSFAIAMFDIDHFKRFNDTYGHLIGDAVLQDLVVTLREVVRKLDSVGRYGGEEFMIIMPDTTASVAMQVAERARLEIQKRGLLVNGQRVELTVSAGVAVYPVSGQDWDTLVSAADTALYQAKSNGRNCVVAA